MDLQSFLCNTISGHLSVTADVTLTYCTLKIYVLGGHQGTGRPYHADDGSFVSGSIPEDEASGAGQQVTGIPNIPRLTKGQQFGGPELNRLSCWRKKKKKKRATPSYRSMTV